MTDLGSLGERAIIRDILWPRYAGLSPGDFGDDCAVLYLNESDSLLVTIDPCPLPMAWQLGFNDYYYAGWLLVTINLSDIAAMGGKPLGLVTSLIMPNATSRADLERLLDGVDCAARQAHTLVLGGNIKEAPYFCCEAAAVGLATTSQLIRRVGAAPGDLVIVVGDLGLFWAGVLSRIKGLTLSDEYLQRLLLNILTPRAKVNDGQVLGENRLVTSGLDNSDGLYPSLKELAVSNSVDIFVDFSNIRWDPVVSEVASQLKLQPERMAMGWGDWQLIVTAPDVGIERIRDALAHLKTPIHVIGRVESGNGRVMLTMDGLTGEMMPLDSERFSPKSWFTSGIDSYIDELVGAPLLTKLD